MVKRKGKDVTIVDKQELTSVQMRTIVRHSREGKYSTYKIALMYGLSMGSVYKIATGEITPTC